ncbi:CAP domain-containing protein [Sphingomonas astaxanthinifaciens]|uniref:SCP domain-containing protein n=1 Tax=Sphingomonas astaxanthinifaciens DSM 22298 TaxID=1123267 RepID=A0ABQ5Z1K7_9SPHN|nr:CAP domain-containing protein [Sphingomonas astaxanthinifaciens]GLR46648.1 hypothetical protein GCM10007925_03590 [Sphingomonas astaxanthinifaciens DSM 22298]
MRRFVPALLLLPLATATAASAQSWEGEVLSLHNRERAAWRVPPLAWDMGLAAAADRWAAELARTNRWGHSPKSLRGNQGENLWMGTRNAYPVSAMVGAWVGERRWFRPGVFPAVSRTGNWADVGHYTQMISARSVRVGCAIRSTRSWSYLVCRYSPSGNVDGLRIP